MTVLQLASGGQDLCLRRRKKNSGFKVDGLELQLRKKKKKSVTLKLTAFKKTNFFFETVKDGEPT